MLYYLAFCFYNGKATTEIYTYGHTLSLHDALPICRSLPTIQRMEASNGQVRGVVDTLVKVIGALESNGIELLGEYSSSTGQGRGVRLREAALADPARPGRGLLSAKFPSRPEIR